MNNSKVEILIEEDLTNVLVQTEPIVVETFLAVTQIGAGNYLFSDLDTYKSDGFLRFLQGKELQFQELGVTKIYGANTGVYIDLASSDLKIRDGATDRFTFSRATGDFTAVGDVAAYSDERLKININVIENALDKVKRLKGVTFTKITDLENRSTGLLAQDVFNVLPEAVRFDEEGYMTVSYGNLVGLLIEAIKELTGVIEHGNNCGCKNNCS